MRLTKVGRVCTTKQSPTLPETLGVNVAEYEMKVVALTWGGLIDILPIKMNF